MGHIPCLYPFGITITTTTIIIIIIIIIRYEFGLDRRVSVSSHNPFKGLPSRLRPFGP
jgi:hypothetical protein